MRFRGVPRGTPSHRSLNENRPSLIVYVRRFPAAERGEEGEKGADRHASKSVVILLPPGRTGSGSSRFYLNRKCEKKKRGQSFDSRIVLVLFFSSENCVLDGDIWIYETKRRKVV